MWFSAFVVVAWNGTPVAGLKALAVEAPWALTLLTARPSASYSVRAEVIHPSPSPSIVST